MTSSAGAPPSLIGSAGGDGEAEPLGGGEDVGAAGRGRQVARLREDLVEVVVGVRRAVVEQHEGAGAGLACHPDRVVDGAVPKVPLDLVLGHGVLGVVDDDVGAVAELEDVVGDVVVGVGGAAPGAVVGEVGDRDPFEVDAVPEGRVGVAHAAGADLGAVDRAAAGTGVGAD